MDRLSLQNPASETPLPKRGSIYWIAGNDSVTIAVTPPRILLGASVLLFGAILIGVGLFLLWVESDSGFGGNEFRLPSPPAAAWEKPAKLAVLWTLVGAGAFVAIAAAFCFRRAHYIEITRQEAWEVRRSHFRTYITRWQGEDIAGVDAVADGIVSVIGSTRYSLVLRHSIGAAWTLALDLDRRSAEELVDGIRRVLRLPN